LIDLLILQKTQMVEKEEGLRELREQEAKEFAMM